MSGAARTRAALACAFVFGALSHFGWVIVHGDWRYHGPAPAWAVWFWYGLCVIDFAVAWLLVKRPRAGLALGFAVMAVSLVVNWTQFPTFEFQFNYVLIGLTAFGAGYALAMPWLWRRAAREVSQRDF